MLLNWISQNFAPIYFEMFLLFGVALVASSVGFYRPLYFINIGYAFAIVLMVILTLIRQAENLSLVPILQNAFLLLWGLRLGIYLVRREFQVAYQKQNSRTHQSFAGMPWGVRIVIWISVSILYVFMFSPSLFRLTVTPVTTSWALYFLQGVGLWIMGSGLILETLADKQKANFKAKFPKKYCDVGLYSWVRCPNYFGEIIFWIGNWVVGLMFYTTLISWVVSIVGMICIVLIMMGSTKRLENAQDERYGERPAYQQYIRSVPVLFPFVSVYSLKKVRVFLE